MSATQELTVEELPVAKKKSGRKQIGRPPLPKAKLKEATTTIRSTDEWRDWVARFARHLGFDKSILFDQALRAFAKVNEFEPPPDR